MLNISREVLIKICITTQDKDIVDGLNLSASVISKNF